ncbi:transcript variant X1 [Nothobranchius furzeri]|uniref:Transcript variant X1 n=1 Tax=Nothobranchius furzeri TaxID=105023 RepID=A0A9D2YBM0_NOTFU|nr:transcript variant X1 [Nothobranchius furzeri]
MFKNVFGSGFVVRTAHVILTWVVTLILFLHDTELRKQEETGQLVQPVLFVLLVLVSVLLYFAVSLMDPGFVLSDERDLQVNRNQSKGAGWVRTGFDGVQNSLVAQWSVLVHPGRVYQWDPVPAPHGDGSGVMTKTRTPCLDQGFWTVQRRFWIRAFPDFLK